MSYEDPFRHRPQDPTPLYPAQLPPELAEFLKDQNYACLTHETNQGTVFVIKVPGAEIQSVQGTVPIRLRQELYDHPAAPVIRMVLTIYDQPQTPLALETFINIADEQQRANFAALSQQEQLPLLFYNEALTHQLTKVVPYEDKAGTTQFVLQRADELLQGIPQDHFDFDAAKAAIMQATQM